MNKLLAVILQLVVLAVLTFGFVVLYGHGPSGFAQGAGEDWDEFKVFAPKVPGALVTIVNDKLNQNSAPAPATPSAEPAATVEPMPEQ